jgi:hypothetical protein
MFVILNPNLFSNTLIDTLFSTEKIIQPEVSIKWMLGAPDSSSDSCSEQEFIDKENICIAFFGKIYNHAELKNWNKSPHTTIVECILQMYLAYGFEQTARRLEGDYTLILLDYNIHRPCSIFYVLQNHLGSRPLYIGTLSGSLSSPFSSIFQSFVISDRMERMELIQDKYSHFNVRTVSPGTYMKYHLIYGASPKWAFHLERTYYTLPISPSDLYNRNLVSNDEIKLDLSLLRRLCDTMYSMIEQWVQTQTQNEHEWAILDMGDNESAFLIATCYSICIHNGLPPPQVVRVGFYPPSDTSSDTISILITPDELNDAVAKVRQIVKTECSRLELQSYVCSYLASLYFQSHTSTSRHSRVSLLQSSRMVECLKHTDNTWETSNDYETSLYKTITTILPTQIQNIHKITETVGIQSFVPFFQRHCLDILLNITSDTRFQWEKINRCWFDSMAKMGMGMDLKTDGVEEEWNNWWSEYPLSVSTTHVSQTPKRTHKQKICIKLRRVEDEYS